MSILVVLDVNDEHKETLKRAAGDAEIIFSSPSEVTDEMAMDADVIIGNIKPAMIKDSKKLKLLQLESAGTDGYTVPGAIPSETVLANATGSYGLAISEHMIGSLLTVMKKLDLYRLNQEQNLWKDEGPVTSVYGSKTLVVGFGDIGSEFAMRMHAMGSEVSAIRRNKTDKPDYIKALYQMDKLNECLEEADIVAICLPGTPETYKLFNAETLSHMKKGSYLINVGRGNIVDSDALADVLCDGHLAGACVDVTDPEPLPADHKLWNAPNILITPHISGGHHLLETHNRIVGIAARNIGHFLAGEEYENIVDMKTGYRTWGRFFCNEERPSGPR